MQRLNIRITGSVQGVFFRRSAKEFADELVLSGWAVNEPDGCVRIEVEGESPSVAQFLLWCESGPIHARVDRVEHTEIPVQGDLDFRIIT
ncbi:TPA: acylphosphatase [Candidatus Uhrbacteria bacterium]|nr:MAG: hypothetical protein A3D69_00090 [Candidatus Uhrbacteria bacterium RIFCSPHIGHO2_02_FULL_54_11]HBL39252.1 acylphosphatase [Candidatus Uhrbacteria bacterium]